MSVFSCSSCYREFHRVVDDSEVVDQFKKWYPSSDITKAKLVCAHCYKIALRIFEIQNQENNWIRYAMSE